MPESFEQFLAGTKKLAQETIQVFNNEEITEAGMAYGHIELIEMIEKNFLHKWTQVPPTEKEVIGGKYYWVYNGLWVDLLYIIYWNEYLCWMDGEGPHDLKKDVWFMDMEKPDAPDTR